MNSIRIYYGDQFNEFPFDSNALLNDVLSVAMAHYKLSTRNWTLKTIEGEPLDPSLRASSISGEQLKLCSIPQAYIPSNDILAGTEDHEYELTVNDALIYQKLLSSRVGNRSGPLLTKKLRMQEEAKDSSNSTKLEHCEIRARFPDRTFIQLQFSPTDTISALYKAVRDSLNDPESEFAIALSHPYKKLENLSETVQGASFGKKTLVVVEIKGNPPYLKTDLLKSAQQSALSLSSNSQASVEPKNVVDGNGPEKPLKKLSKAPKWLKLSKK